MKFGYVAAIAVLNMVAIQAADPLYTVRDYTPGIGSITLSAYKQYNVWDQTGNTTRYVVDIVSELINSTSQEIRVAIQWQWTTRLGIAHE